MKIVQKPVGMMEVFCYLVIDETTGEAILIDPAGNEEELAALLQANKAVCRYIVNTHGHADHTCGNRRMKELTGAPIVLHALDDDFFQMPENQAFARAMGFPISPPRRCPGPGRRYPDLRHANDAIHPHPWAHPRGVLHPHRRPSFYGRHPFCGRRRPDRPSRGVFRATSGISAKNYTTPAADHRLAGA